MYKTLRGEMFDEIAYKQLGSCRYVVALIEANLSLIETFIFDEDTPLQTPDIADSNLTLPKHLPPWRSKSL